MRPLQGDDHERRRAAGFTRQGARDRDPCRRHERVRDRHPVIVDADGQVDALADGPGRGRRHGTLDAASLDSLRQCIDQSGFLDIAEGYKGPTQGKAGDKFCSVGDAPDVTVVATGTSGETRTATAHALGTRGDGCDYGDPPALGEVFAALEQVRQVVSDTATG